MLGLDRVDPTAGPVADTADALSARFAQASAPDILRSAVKALFPGRIALVSSFGADSAVLLHMVSLIDTATPVIFIDTGHLFAETLAYRDRLVARLGLVACRTFAPDPIDLAEKDPDAFLWAGDQNTCCHVRKVLPLERALQGYDAWISGRKRFQAATRTALPLFETEAGRTKVNPLAAWSARDLLEYMDRWDLPPHDLIARNYLSIGCMPCTSPVRPGENARAGRWRGKGKVECGIHASASAGLSSSDPGL